MIFPCRACGRKLDATVDNAGGQISCPGCKASVPVPGQRAGRIHIAERKADHALTDRQTAGTTSHPERDTASAESPEEKARKQEWAGTDHRRGQVLTLIYLLSVFFLLYSAVGYAFIAGPALWTVFVLSISAAPAVLLLWPTPITWMARLAWRAGIRLGKEFHRLRLEQHQLLKQEVAELRKQEEVTQKKERKTWEQQERTRREREEAAWQQKKKKEVRQAIQEAQKQTVEEERKKCDKLADDWVSQYRQHRQGEADASIERYRKERRAQTDDELVTWLEQQKEKWFEEGLYPEVQYWTPEWRSIADQACPECFQGFWGESMEEALLGTCGCVYHIACFKMLDERGERCHGRPGCNSDPKRDFRKITRWATGKKPSVRVGLGSDRRHLRVDASGQTQTVTPSPHGNGEHVRRRIRII